MGVETVSEAIERLKSEGYTLSFRASDTCLEDVVSARKFEPEECFIDSIVRFEGDTNVDDESAIFALSHLPTGVKGLYVVAYGPQMTSEDLAVVEKLRKS